MSDVVNSLNCQVQWSSSVFSFFRQINMDLYFSILILLGSVSPPEIHISTVSHGVLLLCKSQGWYPEPEVFWLDGEGHFVSAESTETVRGPDDLYTVDSRVTVENRQSNSFTCRVQQKIINQTRETHIYVPGEVCFCKFQSVEVNVWNTSLLSFQLILHFCFLLLLVSPSSWLCVFCLLVQLSLLCGEQDEIKTVSYNLIFLQTSCSPLIDGYFNMNVFTLKGLKHFTPIVQFSELKSSFINTFMFIWI